MTDDLSDLYIFSPDPDHSDQASALARTTHMGISAHQDDLELMALHGIQTCYRRTEKWFTGVVCTNGAGSPRSGLYADCSDEHMQRLRQHEQDTAARIGEYAGAVQLGYNSSQVKDPDCQAPIPDLVRVLQAARPEVIYTHNPADKHTTHVAVCVAVLQAIRQLPADQRPAKVYGCEVWRDLDWLPAEHKIVLDVSGQENLAAALMGVYDSQISGGKRYDLATLGRRRAHATFYESHGSDVLTAATYAMELTGLVQAPTLDIKSYVQSLIEALQTHVGQSIDKVCSAE